jgi:hypothetical protein
MAGDVYFFMTRSDLREALAELDNSGRLQFVPSKRYANPEEIVAYSLDELPDLGVTCQESELWQDSVLVMPKGATVGCMKIDHTDGSTSYLVGPAQNPDSLIMWPAGEWDEGCIIRGRFRMSEDTTQAKRINRDFKRVLREKCTVVNNHFLGQQAVQRHRTGTRLALSVRAGAEYDFRLPE